MKRNTWQARFGAKRRALDRKVLAEAEMTIRSENATQRPAMGQEIPATLSGTAGCDGGATLAVLRTNKLPRLSIEERAAIARAFGRPLDLMGPPSVLPKDD